MFNHPDLTNVFALSSKSLEFERWSKWGLALMGLTLLWWMRAPVIEMVYIASDQEAVGIYLRQFGWNGVLLLSLLLVLQVVIAAIPGEAFMIGGGYVYGFGPALAINLTASVFASQLAFLLARWTGRPIVERLVPSEMLDKWNKVATTKGMTFFLIAFMLPVFPGDLMNYVGGLSSLSTLRFFIANLLGRLPRIALITAVGAYGLEVPVWGWVFLLPAAVTIFLIWHFGLTHKQLLDEEGVE